MVSYDAKDVEKKVSDIWKRNKTFEKYLRWRRGKEKFYFLDGPPYASGEIHMGTALNKVLKDFFIRFFKMKGFDVWLQPGYDTHGVPIENKVEKKLNLKNKKDIDELGVEKFIKECKKYATQYIDVMSDQFLDMAVWMDWKNAYLTLDTSYMEGAWHTFKVAFEKNLLYKGNYPVHVCPHCETVVAYNEIEYQNLEDQSIYVKFPVNGKENTYLLIWTTTPWTLPANTGIMVNPNFDYAKVNVGGETLIIANDLVEKIMKKFKIENYSIKETVKGRELVELQYENPLKDLIAAQFNIIGRVVLSEQFVTLDEGSGLVHTAPGHGKEDYKVGREFNLPSLSPLNIDGTFTEDAGFLYNKFALDANKEIIEKLEERGFLFGKEKIKHDYPLCWRCNSQLLMLSVPQWFFKISDFREKLIEENEKVNWVPDWAKKRFRNWLESLDDWPISRQRYWGIPLPIWTCQSCNEIKVIGSLDELPKKLDDIHKPYIDKIELKCKCGGKMKRIPDVLDVWFDSGVSSWASLGYPRKKDLFKRLWPADLNIEGVDQIRGWWNSQMITSYIVFERRPFENIMFHGFVLDLHGKKMSKSKGNVVTPGDVIEKYGRDVLRFYLLKSCPGDNFYFNWEIVKKLLKFFTVFHNSVNFIETYCKKAELKNLLPEDRWILSRFNRLLKNVEECNKNFNCYKSIEHIENFIMFDLSHWYIKLIRERVWPDYKGEDKQAAWATCYHILEGLAKVMAPICPFVTEYIYHNNFGKQSIHMSDWPHSEDKQIDEKLEEEMDIVKKIVEMTNAKRHEKGVKLKYVLPEVKIEGGKIVKSAVKNFKPIIEKMTNVKDVKVVLAEKDELVKVEIDTNITQEIKDEWLLSELIRNVQDARKKMKLQIKDKVELHMPENELFSSNKKTIEYRTGSEVFFGKTAGVKHEFEFEGKKYEFGIRAS